MKKLLLTFYIAFVALSLNATKVISADTIYSQYKDREHSTFSSISVNASKEVCMEMIADLIDQFRGDPEELFQWAFVGIGKQEGDKSDKNEVLLILKQALYDKKSEIGTLVFDIDVKGFAGYKDVRIDSKVSQYEVDSLVDAVSVDVFYSNSLLKKTYGMFFVEELDENNTQLSIDIHVRFGWFFNIFITKRRYKNLVEWRTAGFMNNLKKEAEKRHALNL